MYWQARDLHVQPTLVFIRSSNCKTENDGCSHMNNFNNRTVYITYDVYNYTKNVAVCVRYIVH